MNLNYNYNWANISLNKYYKSIKYNHLKGHGVPSVETIRQIISSEAYTLSFTLISGMTLNVSNFVFKYFINKSLLNQRIEIFSSTKYISSLHKHVAYKISCPELLEEGIFHHLFNLYILISDINCLSEVNQRKKETCTAI